MKKFLFLLLLLIPLPVEAISAKSAILIDQDSGRILFSKDAFTPSLIASTTKIMTALVTIENQDLDKIVTVDEKVLDSYGSGIYIKVGEKISILDLLYGLMLRSGNDAAIVLANNVFKSQKEFVKMMNKKALELGMKQTIFYNPHGLEESDGSGNTSTAYDMALLMQAAMQNKDFQKITKTTSYTAKSNEKTYLWQNKNKLLKSYKYTTGGKTGFTQKARRTLVTSASKDGKSLIAVTFNDPNDFSNHQKLYEEYFAKYEIYTLVSKNKPVKDKSYKNETLYIKNDIKALLTKDEKKQIKIKTTLEKENKFNTSNTVGTIKVYLNNTLLKEEPIYLKSKKSQQGKTSIWEKIKSWFH